MKIQMMHCIVSTDEIQKRRVDEKSVLLSEDGENLDELFFSH